MRSASLLEVLGRVRAHLARGLGVAFILATVAVGGGVLVSAWWLAGPEGWRQGTPVPLLLLLGGGGALLALGVWSWLSFRQWSREARLAGEIERATGLPRGSVQAQAELLRAPVPAGSEALVRAGEGALLSGIPEAVAELAGGPGRRIGRIRGVAGAGALAMFLVVAIVLLTSSERARLAWEGLPRATALLARGTLPALEVRPGDARLPRGESPGVQVVATGRERIDLHWQGVGDVPGRLTLEVVDGLAEGRLPPLEGDLEYWATSPDGARSARHRLTPGDPSLLQDLRIEISYPEYTGLLPETVRGVPPAPFRIPEGTALTFSGRVDGAGEEIRLLHDEAGTLARFPVDAEGFVGTWVPTRSGRVEWSVVGGTPGAVLPAAMEVEVQPDEPPVLVLPVPGGDVDLPLTLRLPILVQAADDHGVAWIEVETAFAGADGAEVGTVVDRVPAGGRSSVVLRPVLDFTEWGLRAGDEVHLRARVSDQAPSPQVVSSPTYVLRMPDPAQMREIARERIQGAVDRTGEILDRANRDASAFRELARRAELERARSPGTGGQNESFREREELRDALERQEDGLRELEEVQARLEEARRALAEEDARDTELAERIRELERLLAEVLGPEARERLDDLLGQLRSGESPANPDELLADLSDRQDELRNRLEETLERLRRAAIDEGFRGLEEEVRTLAQEERDLAERMGSPESADAQEALNRRTEAAREGMTDLEERIRSGGDPETGDRVVEAASELEGASESMAAAAEAGRQGQEEEAVERANEAAQRLEQALEQLEQARDQWEDEPQADHREAFQEAAQSALALSRRQAELRREFRIAGPQRRSRFEGEQAAILAGVRHLSDRLDAATRETPDLAEAFARALGRTVDALQLTMQRVGRAQGPQIPQSEESADAAQRALHEVALLALTAAESGGEGGESGSRLEELLAELAAVAASQEALNQGTGSLGEETGADGSADRLDELAGAQAAIAGQLDELAGRPGADELPTDLRELSAEGMGIAEALRQGRFDATTQERQARFLDLLLSAGRTLERDGPTEEREGSAPGPVERQVVSPLPEDLLEALALPLPSAEALEALSPGQRRLVLEYFERVNRRETGGGGP